MSAALSGALRRCPSLAVLWPYRAGVIPCKGSPFRRRAACCSKPLLHLALRRTGRLAAHPARTTSISQFILNGYLDSIEISHSTMSRHLTSEQIWICDAIRELIRIGRVGKHVKNGERCLRLLLLCKHYNSFQCFAPSHIYGILRLGKPYFRTSPWLRL